MRSASFIKIILLGLLSAISLRLSFPSFDFFIFAWLVFVPMLYLAHELKAWQIFLTASLSFATAIFHGVFWIEYLALNYVELQPPLNYALALGFALYFGAFYGIIMVLFSFISKRSQISSIIIFPITFCALWSIFPEMFKHSLPATQANFPIALQALDLFGEYGLLFLLSMANALAFEVISGRVKKNWILATSASLLLAAWFIYGAISLEYWRNEENTWPRATVGFIQPDKAAGDARAIAGYSIERPWELVQSEELAKLGAKFIFWPEGNDYNYYRSQAIRNSINRSTSAFGYNLFLVESIALNDSNNESNYYNAMLFIDNLGFSHDPYLKAKLMPFGEYLPAGFSTISKALGVPFSSFTAGDSNLYFKTPQATIIPIICYESVFGGYVASQAGVYEASKLLVVSSQNGWYNSRVQSWSHINMSLLRSVENRVPQLNLMQKGPSVLIYPSSKVIKLTEFQMRDSAIFDIGLNPSPSNTIYSRYPNFVIYLSYILFFSLLLFALKPELMLLKQRIFTRSKL